MSFQANDASVSQISMLDVTALMSYPSDALIKKHLIVKKGEKMDKQIDFTKLQIDTSNLSSDFILLETKPDLIKNYTPNEAVNDWHIEHIRRFNHAAYALQCALSQLGELAKNLSSVYSETVQRSFRMAARQVCLEVDMYLESYKEFLRYYFFMDRNKTDDGKKLFEALDLFLNMSNGAYIKDVKEACNKLIKNPYYDIMTKVRNAETHNESPIELMRYTLENSPESHLIHPVPQGFIISDQDLYDMILDLLEDLVPVAAALQNMLEHISPLDVYNFLEPQDGQLKNILIMAERYKADVMYVSKFEKGFTKPMAKGTVK